MKLTDITLGTKLEIELLNNLGEKIEPFLASKFEWAETQDMAFIGAPIHEGLLYPVHIGSTMDLLFINKFDYYTFNAKVIERRVSENIALLKVKLLGDIKKIQRRQYYRFECSRQMDYRLHEGSDPGDTDVKYTNGVTRDLSGGGLCFVTVPKLEMGKLLECELFLDTAKSVKFVGRIVRVSKLPSEQKFDYEIGLLYEGIENRDREAIIKFIFEEQRKLRKKGLI